jgi:hypothetical protein
LKAALWIFLGLTTLFVFITSEVLLVTDYPMYHAYRLQVIGDRHLLIPHTLAGILALAIGPINFSSRIRVCGRFYGDRSGQRTARFAGNVDAGRRVDRLHHRGFHHRAQPADRHALAVDGAVLRCDVYLRLQPRAELVAAVLEPPGR